MSKRTVRAAKKIMIAHKYHNQISEFYYPGPGAQSSNFFYVSISLSVMQGICTAPPIPLTPSRMTAVHRSPSLLPGEELILLSTEPPLRWALKEVTGVPDRSVPALIEPSQFELPLRDIFTLITHCLPSSNTRAFPLGAHLPLSFVLAPSRDQRVLSSEQQFTPGPQRGQGRKRGCCFCLCGLET